MTNHDQAVTAMNILDGMEHRANWEILQPAWEDQGMGFIDFTVWISGIAEYICDELSMRDPQDFPGVFDYEVSCELGELISSHTRSTGRLPTTEEIAHWVTVLIDEFFDQREEHIQALKKFNL